MKQLCKLKKSEKNRERLAKFEEEPKFICKKCGRLSNKKKVLCKPKSL